ncbi:hypothetical protein BD626DRAFT_537823 [Schizophyllum amplum]|uniref:Alcohol acetyltransferase n=1 Tax=Schizophyllum amplum TaxID=97359 RepID=A0A550CBC1_9AGAR|nr:hypothetical protein BD626DRAFT_537823 [Auriculariopsis ampla]
MDAPTRKLSLHERYSVMRRNASFAHPIVLIVTYPSAAAAPTVDFLSQRITELQEHFPLLRSDVMNAKTREPVFQQRATPYTPDEILRQEQYVSRGGDREDKEGLLFHELKRMMGEGTSHPLWQTTLYAASSANSKSYLTLSVDHVITDGRGLALLAHALLSSDISSLPMESLQSIPLLEDTHDIRPSYAHLVPIVLKELVIPKLPTIIQQYIKPADKAWPAGYAQAARSPTDCEWDLSLLELSASLVASLKSIGKERGVKTLHPLLKVAYLVAMWAVFGRDAASFTLQADTPRSERNASLGHAYCTANYTSSVDVHVQPVSTDDFWVMAQRMASELSSPQGIQKGRYTMGMLSFIPDPVPDPSKAETDRPTGWEEFFLNKAHSPEPFGGSLQVSNLGYVDLPPGAEDVAWSQACWPAGPAICTGVIGHKGGVRVATVWREGAAVEKAEVKTVEEVYMRVLCRLVDPSRKGWTLNDLTA